MDVRIRLRRPKDPAVWRGGECYKDYLGQGNRSVVYPYSSVGNTFTHCHASGEKNSDATQSSRRGRFRPLRSLTCRTYVPQAGYLFSSFDMLYRKRKHSTAKQHRKNNENDTEFSNFRKEKQSLVPSCVIMFYLIGTPYTDRF